MIQIVKSVRSCVILVGFFTEGAYAERVAHNYAEGESHAGAHATAYAPTAGSYPFSAAPSTSIADRAHFNLHGREGSAPLSRSQSVWMSVQDANPVPVWKPELPNGWKYEKYYRFVPAQNFNSVDELFTVWRTPNTFQGTQMDGTYNGTSRVGFTLPATDDVPKQFKKIELVKSIEDDNPSFGAVEMKLPLDITVGEEAVDLVVDSSKAAEAGVEEVNVTETDALVHFSRLRVTNVGSDAEQSGILRGDIIRAVSMPDPKDIKKPWWQKVSNRPDPPVTEEGMVMLDDRGVSAYVAALQENKRVNGENAQVVLLVERPESSTYIPQLKEAKDRAKEASAMLVEAEAMLKEAMAAKPKERTGKLLEAEAAALAASTMAAAAAQEAKGAEAGQVEAMLEDATAKLEEAEAAAKAKLEEAKAQVVEAEARAKEAKARLQGAKARLPMLKKAMATKPKERTGKLLEAAAEAKAMLEEAAGTAEYDAKASAAEDAVAVFAEADETAKGAKAVLDAAKKRLSIGNRLLFKT